MTRYTDAGDVDLDQEVVLRKDGTRITEADAARQGAKIARSALTPPAEGWPHSARQRLIQLWCEEPSHDPLRLGQLVSSRESAARETWRLDGLHVSTTRFVRRRTSEDGMALREGDIAERSRAVCPACGFDVVAGDRLGPHPGIPSMLEPGSWSSGALTKTRETDARLSKLADAGAVRLSLSTLGRILSM